MSTFTPDSPLAAVERFLRDASEPDDFNILRKVLFDGERIDPHNFGSSLLGFSPWTPEVCEHYGFTQKNWNKAVVAAFGDRDEDVYPTFLLAAMTAYDALARTNHLQSIDDERLWQQDHDDAEEGSK